MKLRLNKDTLRLLQVQAARAAKKAAPYTPLAMVAVGAAGCFDTLGCKQN